MEQLQTCGLAEYLCDAIAVVRGKHVLSEETGRNPAQPSRNPNKETSKTAISRGFIWLSYFPRAELVYPATGEEHPAKSFENGNLAQEWARELFGG